MRLSVASCPVTQYGVSCCVGQGTCDSGSLSALAVSGIDLDSNNLTGGFVHGLTARMCAPRPVSIDPYDVLQVYSLFGCFPTIENTILSRARPPPTGPFPNDAISVLRCHLSLLLLHNNSLTGTLSLGPLEKLQYLNLGDNSTSTSASLLLVLQTSRLKYALVLDFCESVRDSVVEWFIVGP